MVKVLVVGQTPPPYHGQALMIEQLLRANTEEIEFAHVRMAFSKDIEEVGRFRPRKLAHLLSTALRIVVAKLRTGSTVLYYPPSGPGRIPFFRDLALLLATRPLFERTVFHFHAGGLSDLLERLPRALEPLFQAAYSKPDLSIVLSEDNFRDGEIVDSKRIVVIPNGIEDHFPRYGQQPQRGSKAQPGVLFVGMLRETKGVNILLEACRQLLRSGVSFRLDLMGRFESREFEQKTRQYVKENHLEEVVSFLGVLTGREKWRAYASADIFCFPSFYESENLPVVVIEAMQFQLPVVATRWRGIPSLVREGENGFLVSPRDPLPVAQRLGELIQDSDLREQLGARGRQLFLEDYTLEKWRKRMEHALLG